MSLSEEQIQQTVTAIFIKYDKDNSGTLDAGEAFNFLRDGAAHAGLQIDAAALQEQVNDLLQSAGKPANGSFNRAEMVELFREISQ